MKRKIQGAAFAAAPFLIGSTADAQRSDAYTAPRNAVVDASGARLVEVEGGAGNLRVEGKPGLRQVQVSGTARASSQQYLSRIKLIAERRGDVVFIKADIPEENWRDNNNSSGALDLVIQVPQGMNTDISDGSGDLKVLNVGALDATDGSGDIDVRNVTGSFTVASDGSGSIYATDIRGSVVVQNDGSGEIDVNKVGRDFKVESKGRGSIEYTAVTGQVDVPDRRHGRYRRGEER
ncbi:MAG TPA: hypothetical protein VIM36_08050 [Gemmatimonadaceae bacterium]